MKLVPLHTIFKVEYGNSFDLTMLVQCEEGVNYVSRTKENNGVSAIVEKIKDIEPFHSGLITVAGSGNSVLETYIQPFPFYTGYHVFVLNPKVAMSDAEKLFYCYCLKLNQYKYSFGRQANKTLKDLLVPDKMPASFEKVEINELNTLKRDPINNQSYTLDTNQWYEFSISELFQVNYGANLELNAMKMKKFGIPFVSRTAKNNGISDYVEELQDIKPNPANTISVSGGGSVLECFLQEKPYYSGRDLYYLTPKFESDKYSLLFIITLIRQEKYRFNYGRQANKTLKHLMIKLPVDKVGNPDFKFMGNYIKSLPYSRSI